MSEKPVLPALPESILSRKPVLSGACPGKAKLMMFLYALPISLVLGVAARYVGLLVGIIAGFLAAIPNMITEMCGFYFCGLILFSIVVILIAFAGYPALVGWVTGRIVASLGRKGNCRNTEIAAVAGLVNGILVFAVHSVVSYLAQGGLHPFTVSTELLESIFDASISGTPWWMYVLIVIEFIILIAVAFVGGSEGIEENNFCETHQVWYGKWKEGYLSAEAAQVIATSLETEDASLLDNLETVSKETHPHLLVKTRECPTSPTCDIEVAAELSWEEITTDKNGKESTSIQTEKWFNVMMTAEYGREVEEKLIKPKALPAG